MKRTYAVLAGLAACVIGLGAMCVYDAGVNRGWKDSREEYRVPFGGVGHGHWHRARRPLPAPTNDVYEPNRAGRWAWFVNGKGEWLYRQLSYIDEIEDRLGGEPAGSAKDDAN